MKFKKEQCYHGFRLVESKNISELNIDGYYFKHEHTGAKLIYLDAKDSNNVFSITFKTLPTDQSGVAHIVEHAVCCASKKYPLKDTFMEMDKGSLNTALNACTYKDMTMYYVASQNEKDLLQLMDVYMDLVFNPLIYEDENLFKQEGWHYHLESLKGELTYNGIVYNEMKGTYGEPGSILEQIVHEALFEDTLYQYDAGGLPAEIVNLSWKDALDFHQKFYTPDNATLFLYGDGDVDVKMAYLNDVYLSQMVAKGNTTHAIISQPTFEMPKYKLGYYPVIDEDETKDNYLNLTFVVGDGVDGKKRFAFQILEHMLLKSAASPLQQALIEKHQLGTALAAGGYDPGKKQPTFAITLTGCEIDKKEKFKAIVFETLEKLTQQGIDEALIDAAIDTITFSLYEGESEGEPLGVLYSEDIQLSMHYEGEPFEYLSYKKYLNELAIDKTQGYFEEMLKNYFLNNTHYVEVLLQPSEISDTEDLKEKQRLEHYLKTLTQAEKRTLVKKTKQLEAIQLRENTKEELVCLPRLTKEDLKTTKKALSFQNYYEDNVPIVTTIEATHGISYYHVLLDASSVPIEQWCYLGVLTTLISYLSTRSTHYAVLENQINSLTGALNCAINAYANAYDTNQYKPMLKISTKMLDEKSEAVLELLGEMMTETRFDEKEKIHEILKATVYELERSFTGAPEYRASKRVYTGFSKAAVFEDYVSGLEQYHFLKELCEQFETRWESLQQQLEALYTQLMTRENLQISLMAREDQIPILVALSRKLCRRVIQGESVVSTQSSLKQQPIKEAIMTSNDVQAIAWGGNIKQYEETFSGAWYVVGQFLESNYLWDKIRLQGGAYGCDLTISRDGNIVICSYCDPQIQKTLKTYKAIGKYLSKIELDEETIERYVIKTIGMLDYPLTMEQKSERATIHYLCEVDPFVLEQERKEILEVTIDDFRKVGKILEKLVDNEMYCIIGSKQKLLKAKCLFKKMLEI